RTFSCDNCDTVLDRDFNASLNLKYAKEYTIITER
ncbi:zinc ribbon domain-containing protein, partial [Sporosarcina sp. YIM B06819]